MGGIAHEGPGQRGQPAASGDDVRRARGRDRVAGGVGPSVVAGDADRGGRGRQDPPRAAGRGGSHRRVPRWCVVVRVRAGHRSGGGVGDAGGVPAGAAAAGSGARRVGARVSRGEAAVVGARQLRAPPRCGRAPGGRDRASLPAGVGAGDEPGGPRRWRASGWSRCRRWASRPAMRTCDELRQAEAVRLFWDRASAAKQRLRAHRPQRRCGRGVVPTPRRDPARDRARGGAGAVAVTGGSRRPARSAVQAPHARQPRGAGASPDAAEHDRLVL